MTTPLSSGSAGDADEYGRIKFGIFLAPWHAAEGDPGLQYRRDLDLINLAEDLGFEEVWVGEHMSNGHEIILSPEVFLAAASARTSRIKLGTGVSSLPYHHPMTIANRMVMLDQLSRGRAMLGIGPGQLPTDATMLGINPADQRRMMIESAECVVRLLRGEVVSAKTDWFTLHEARLQVLPVDPDGLEAVVASIVSPTGSTLAGRLGLGMLSMAATDVEGINALDSSWANLEHHSQENGYIADRRSWRVVGAMHLAETPEQAWAEARKNVIESNMRLVETTLPAPAPWTQDPDLALEIWSKNGIGPLGGRIVVGTPDDAVSAIRLLQDKSGGFGTYVQLIHNAASWEATKRSLELFAERVIPEINGTNRARLASRAWSTEQRAARAAADAAIVAANAGTEAAKNGTAPTNSVGGALSGARNS